MSRRLIAALLFLISLSIHPQTRTYFVKYKAWVSKEAIENKVISKEIIPGNIISEKDKSSLSVEYFARNLTKSDPELSRIIKVSLSPGSETDQLVSSLSADPSVEYIQESVVYKIDFTPNDTLSSKQWALSKIDAFSAWDITTGDTSIIIGIIDTGIDFLHPDLKNKIYRNYSEDPLNNLDDDNNGFTDDYMGWDFTDRTGFPFDSTAGDYLVWDNLPADDNGHGTYIAGIAGAEMNNTVGIAGAAPGVKLLNIRAFDPSGFGEEDDVAAGILYAVSIGAKVINMSFGDDAFSFVLRDVIKYAYRNNVVLVASSGNSGSDQPHYPSGYSEVISVGNTTAEDYIAQNSNFGSTIDLTAPGSSVLTTSKNNGYTEVSGTSASSPYVSAAAALVLSLGEFSNAEVEEILKQTSDDIDEPGWDTRSGAGRLNLFKAVSSVSPSIVKFTYPLQDFTTYQDTLSVSASVLSPYFKNYQLLIGTGLNPGSWEILIENDPAQVSNQKIFELNLSDFPDTVFCLRIILHQTNGRTLEERVNFFVSRTSPIINLINAGPCYYGDKTTLLAAVYTDKPAVAKMFYRKKGEAKFNYVALDGFTINNKFVRNEHYGFVPKHLIEQNSDYEVFFEAENLAGLKSTLKKGDDYFVFNTAFDYKPAAEYVQQFSLPAGNLFNQIVVLPGNREAVALREFSNSGTTIFHNFEGNSFIKTDSLKDKIIKDFGDFNNNGSPDLLTLFVKNGYIEEFENSRFVQKYEDASGSFWPIFAEDIDKDGSEEIAVIDTDSSLTIWNVHGDLSVSGPQRLTNFTPDRGMENRFDSPDAVITDSDNNGNNEIWMVDNEGDILSYEFNQVNNSYNPFKTVETGLIGSSALISAGDYNGDSSKDIAVLLHSIEEKDISPFYRLVIFSFSGDSLNIILEQTFIDASVEFNSSFRRTDNAVELADLDNDGSDELILFLFPYSYILKNDVQKSSIISYKENINSNAVLISDLNKNGIKETAFPSETSITFSEFIISLRTAAPFNLEGRSIDSAAVMLKWSGEGEKFYIFKGDNPEELLLYDSAGVREYLDLNITLNKNYYYAVKSLDPNKSEPLSALSQVLNVYSHKPAEVILVQSRTPNSLLVSFSEKIRTAADNLQALEVLNFGFPNSISPADEYSLLLSFSENLPPGVNLLRINNLTDLYNSPVKEDTVSFIVETVPHVMEFFISSHRIINPYLVKVEFNLEVDELSAAEKTNYIFEPSNGVTKVTVDQSNRKIIYLDLTGQKPVGSVGQEYRLKISGLKSSASAGFIDINSGAGSYIVLTGIAENLSGMYVYPSPARINSGAGKIIFANLPGHVKISIWTLSGIRVKEIQETILTGGLHYDLKDEQGQPLSSGIYFYRIIQLDDLNNEIDEKIGKFAVVK